MNLQTSKRILIIGSPGSGKSTLAGILEKKLSLPVIHLDQINWKNNKETLSSQEFDEKLISILSSRVWIIDGNYNRTLELRIQAADTVIWLDFPRLLCVYRSPQTIYIREIQRILLWQSQSVRKRIYFIYLAF